MNIVPYRAKTSGPAPAGGKDMAEPSGQFRGKGIHTHGKDKVFN